ETMIHDVPSLIAPVSGGFAAIVPRNGAAYNGFPATMCRGAAEAAPLRLIWTASALPAQTATPAGRRRSPSAPAGCGCPADSGQWTRSPAPAACRSEYRTPRPRGWPRFLASGRTAPERPPSSSPAGRSPAGTPKRDNPRRWRQCPPAAPSGSGGDGGASPSGCPGSCGRRRWPSGPSGPQPGCPGSARSAPDRGSPCSWPGR
ncbi:hypothetical protein PBMFNG_PBMFNG_11620, partial [Dysosmobacter welbionis]